MNKEEARYYNNINGDLYLYNDTFEDIERKNFELTEKLYKNKISAKDYKEASLKHCKIIEKASKFVDTKNEFLMEYSKRNMPLKVAKESWKHEREHFVIIKQNALIPKIGVVRLTVREQPINGELQIGLKPYVHHNLLDFIGNWSLEKIKQSSLNMLDVTKLSESDKEQAKILKNL